MLCTDGLAEGRYVKVLRCGEQMLKTLVVRADREKFEDPPTAVVDHDRVERLAAGSQTCGCRVSSAHVVDKGEVAKQSGRHVRG